MKNKRKQMMISSLIMLIVAAMALTTTTLAWFTTGNTGTVEDFEFTAEDATGIQLSVDAETWKSTIASTEIATQVTADTGNVGKAQTGMLFTGESLKFIPLSTTPSTISGGKLTMFKTTADNDKLKASTLLDTEKYYYVFNIYVNNLGSEEKDLNLSTASVKAKNADSDKNTQLAARVAFIDNGSVSKINKTAAQTKAEVIALDKATKDNVVIYEPNASMHTGFAQTYLGVTGVKQDYYGVKAASAENFSYETEDGFIKSTEAGVEKVTTIAAPGSSVAKLAADSITKLTVCVWIEGQDCDCNNDVASGKVTVNFGFTTAAVVAPTTAQYQVTYNKGAAPEGTKVPSDSNKYETGVGVVVLFDGVDAWDGHTFLGWATDPEATVPDYSAAGATTFTMGEADVTLYAVWEAVD